MNDNPKATTAIDMRPDPAYWQALGQFVETFSLTEVAILHFAAVYMEMPVWIAQAAFNGQRGDGVIAAIKQTTELRLDFAQRKLIGCPPPPSKETIEEMDDVFKHWSDINGFRNRVVHQASYLKDGERVVTDIAKRIPTRVQEKRADAEILARLTHDLMKIQMHLISWFVSNGASPILKSPSERAEGMPILGTPWQGTIPPNRFRLPR